MRAVLFATAMEAAPFIDEMSLRLPHEILTPKVHRFEKPAGESAVIVAVIGMGTAAARDGARHIIHTYAPGAVLNVGIAGALASTVTVGEIYRVSHAVAWPNGAQKAHPFAADPFADLPAATLVTSADPVFDEALKREMAPHGEMVDMEGAIIAAVAAEAGIPCAAVKGISDTAASGDREMLLKNLSRVCAALAVALAPRLCQVASLKDIP